MSRKYNTIEGLVEALQQFKDDIPAEDVFYLAGWSDFELDKEDEEGYFDLQFAQIAYFGELPSDTVVNAIKAYIRKYWSYFETNTCGCHYGGYEKDGYRLAEHYWTDDSNELDGWWRNCPERERKYFHLL